MSDTREKDRWRELADLLGLPPEQKAPEKEPTGSSDTGHEPPSHDRSVVESHERDYEPPAPAYMEETEPVAEDAFEPAPAEEMDHGEKVLDGAGPMDSVSELPESELDEQVPARYEPEPGMPSSEDDNAHERPRRGRRRGRRGRRGDERDRDERGRRDDRPRRNQSDDGAEAEPEERDVYAEPAAERAEGSQTAEDAERVEDEVFETPGPAAGAPDDDAEDEVDKLTDWNVPSWSELIASLYRPER